MMNNCVDTTRNVNNNISSDNNINDNNENDNINIMYIGDIEHITTMVVTDSSTDMGKGWN